MADKLEERLRAHLLPICGEAADEITRLNALVAEMREGLIESKREMWASARHQWNLEDFKNWAVIQQIGALITKASRDSGHG